MTELTYPNFIANQVLTNRQLNDLRDYLDAQTRTGRLRTVGTGILCGLSWRLDVREAETMLVVERGHGLTSAGYLIALDPEAENNGAEFVGTARYCDPNVDPEAEAPSDSECPVPMYEPWVTGVAPPRHVDLVELATREQMTREPDRFAPLSADDLDGRVVVLYLEEVTQELDSCIVTSCEGMGEDIHFTVRALLAREEDLDPLPDQLDCPEALPPLYLPRFHAFVRETEAGDLAEIESAEEIHAAYTEAVAFGVERLGERTEELYARYGRRFDLDQEAVQRGLEGLERLREGMEDEDRSVGPVLYDLLRVLFDAANDVARRACMATRSCDVGTGFDRHLLLGSRDRDRGYRHLFRPAPPHQSEGDADWDVGYAFERFVRILAGLAMEDDVGEFDVRILPSGLPSEPMATRAVPRVVEVDAVLGFWHDDRCCDARPLVHYFLLPNETHDDVPFDLETAEVDARVPSLLRVEGHLDRDVSEVVKALVELRRRLNLEFTIVVLGFEELDELEALRDDLEEGDVPGVLVDIYEAFVDAHPGMEPLHGVPPGGTFVLVVEDETVVADFALHCCTAAPVEVEEEESFLSGMVVGEGPMEGVTVTLSPPPSSGSSVETGDDGRFDFGALPPGTYTVTASQEGFQSQSVTVTLEPGESESVILILREAEVRVEITGIVYEAPNTDDRISEANVVVTTVPDTETTTDEEGAFAFSDLPHEPHQLRVTSEDFQTANVGVEFAADETSRHVEIPLIPDTGSIAGTVVDEETEEPIEEATVTISDDEDSTVTTPEDGSWDFSDLPPGTYQITATAEGFEDNSISVSLSAGQDRTGAEIPLSPVTVAVDVLLCGGDHPDLEVRWDEEVLFDGATSPAHSGWGDQRLGSHKLELITGDGAVLASEEVLIASQQNHLVVVTGQLVEEEVVVSAIPLSSRVSLSLRRVFARFANAYPEDSEAQFFIGDTVVAENVEFGTATPGQLIPAVSIAVTGENQAGSRTAFLDLSGQSRRSGTIVLCRDTLHYVGDGGTLLSHNPNEPIG